MKNNTQKTLIVGWLICASCCQVHSQGTFLNLNFESANLPVVPAGQSGGFVSSLDAIPNWTAFYSTNQTTQIFHNNYTLGAVNISILGPSFNFFPVLQGSYSVLLQSGLSVSDAPALAAIAQTGVIPSTALSVQFLASRILGSSSAQLNVSIGGQIVSLVPLSITANHTVYGADVSAYSGLTRELRIASAPSAVPQYGSFLIDGIAFSNQPIPEPSTLGMFGLGAMLFIYRSRLLSKK